MMVCKNKINTKGTNVLLLNELHIHFDGYQVNAVGAIVLIKIFEHDGSIMGEPLEVALIPNSHAHEFINAFENAQIRFENDGGTK